MHTPADLAEPVMPRAVRDGALILAVAFAATIAIGAAPDRFAGLIAGLCLSLQVAIAASFSAWSKRRRSILAESADRP